GWTIIRPPAATGPRHRDAIYTGLPALAATCRRVVLHDAARPLVMAEWVVSGLYAVQQTGAACAAVPMIETLKRVREGVVIETLDRRHLALLQTPQVFDRARLEAAYEHLPLVADPPNAALVAAGSGLRIVPFPGHAENIEVATSDDLLLAERLLRTRHSTDSG